MISAWVGWMFDGYENYAFVLVMPIVVYNAIQLKKQRELR